MPAAVCSKVSHLCVSFDEDPPAMIMRVNSGSQELSLRWKELDLVSAVIIDVGVCTSVST